MPRRELKHPQWDVSREPGTSADVVVELVVPHSRFGAVDVVLDVEEAAALGNSLAAFATPKPERKDG